MSGPGVWGQNIHQHCQDDIKDLEALNATRVQTIETLMSNIRKRAKITEELEYKIYKWKSAAALGWTAAIFIPLGMIWGMHNG